VTLAGDTQYTTPDIHSPGFAACADRQASPLMHTGGTQIVLLATRLAQLLIRALGAIMLVLGLLFWTGNALTLIPIHMLVGLLLVLMLWTLAALAARAGVDLRLVLLAVAWGAIVPILGLTQDTLLLGPAHVLIQVLHLCVGLAAIALGEVLGRRARLRLSNRARPRPVTAAV
jgi:hypothetical protein